MSSDVLLLAENTGIGGINTYLILLAEEMRRRRVKVDVAAIWPKPDNWLQQRCDESGFPLEVLARRRSVLEFPRIPFRLASLIRRGQHRLVHAQGYYSDLFAHVARVLTPAKPAVVATVHGFPESRNVGLRILYWLDKRSLRLNAKTITQTVYTARSVYAAGVDEERVAIVLNGIASRGDAERIAAGGGTAPERGRIPVVTFVGRLSPEKGCHVLIDAAKVLREKGLVFRVCIVGDGPDREMLADRVRAAGLADIVDFEGWRPDVSQYYRAAAVIAVPSLRENQPLTALEAMLYGCPVVATDVGGVPEIVVNNRTGLLVSAGDPFALAGALETCLRSSDVRANLARAGQEYVLARHTVEQMVDGTIAAYGALIQSPAVAES